MAKRLRKTTGKQYEELLAFLEKHKSEILVGKVTPADVKKIDILWEGFSKTINSMAIGPLKTGRQWKKIYLEWKRNTKRKSKNHMALHKATGGRSTAYQKPLSALEERFLTLISKIHLGDADISETIIGVEENTTLENIKPVLITNVCSNSSFDVDVPTELLMNEEITGVSSAPVELEFLDPVDSEENSASSAEPSTSHMHPRTTRKSKFRPANYRRTSASHSKRYAGYYVDSAAQAYKDAQNMRIACAQENSAAINNLSVSITKLADSIASYSRVTEMEAETNLTRAKTDMLNAKLKLLQYSDKNSEG